jgi:5'-deoxynucleotidase YfbR-like HD superfamily hydrolase
MELFEKIHWMRHGGALVRCHSERFVGDRQTVFHHSAGVALILIEVLGEQCSRELLIAALQHDLAEGFSGDVPAPTKWSLGEGFFDAFEEEIRRQMELAPVKLTPGEKALLKAADFLDLCWTCYDQRRLGNVDIDRVMLNLEVYNGRTRVVEAHPRMDGLYRKVRAAWYEFVRRDRGPFLQILCESDFYAAYRRGDE